MKEERRTHIRVPEKNSVAVTVQEAPDAPGLLNKTFFCNTKDLSEGGLKVHTHTLVPEGTVLGIRVALSSPPQAFKFTGRVAWTQEDSENRVFTYGIAFTECDEDTQLGWRHLLNRKIPRTDTPTPTSQVIDNLRREQALREHAAE